MDSEHLLSLTRQACEACDQRIEDSTQWLLEAVEADDQAEALKAEILRRGAMTIVHQVRHGERRAVKAGRPGRCSRGAAAIASAAGTIEQTILDMTIGDTTLGRMTGADLDPWIEKAAENEKGWSARREFFERVRRSTPDGKTVHQAVGAAKARKLWDETVGRKDVTEPIEKIGHGETPLKRAGPSE